MKIKMQRLLTLGLFLMLILACTRYWYEQNMRKIQKQIAQVHTYYHQEQHIPIHPEIEYLYCQMGEEVTSHGSRRRDLQEYAKATQIWEQYQLMSLKIQSLIVDIDSAINQSSTMAVNASEQFFAEGDRLTKFHQELENYKQQLEVFCLDSIDFNATYWAENQKNFEHIPFGLAKSMLIQYHYDVIDETSRAMGFYMLRIGTSCIGFTQSACDRPEL